MNDTFDIAFEAVIGHEAGFQKDPKDPGNYVNGELIGTKYGISARSYPKVDIPNLTLEQAKEIYHKDFWLKAKCDIMPIGVDYLMFDASINHGRHRANMFLQSALGVIVDGIVGPKTLAALEAVPEDEVDDLMTDFCIARQKYYESLSTYSHFKNGWRRRAFETLSFALFLHFSSTLDRSKVTEEVHEETPEETKQHWFRRI